VNQHQRGRSWKLRRVRRRQRARSWNGVGGGGVGAGDGGVGRRLRGEAGVLLSSFGGIGLLTRSCRCGDEAC